MQQQPGDRPANWQAYPRVAHGSFHHTSSIGPTGGVVFTFFLLSYFFSPALYGMWERNNASVEQVVEGSYS